VSLATGTFLLCAPVQSAASCERLFKDFALYHTKHRNRMNPPTYLKQTQIKHDMVRKYGPADAQRETGERKSSNRIPIYYTVQTHPKSIVLNKEYSKETLARL
jgi:hypothetical protein